MRTQKFCVGLLCCSILWFGKVVVGVTLRVNGNDDRVAEVSFTWGDDIPRLAVATADALELDTGEGCTDRACVARLLEVTMHRQLASEFAGNNVSSRGVVDKSFAVYLPQVPAHAAEQAVDEANRAATLAQRSALPSDHRPRTARGTTSPTGKFAAVPCVPPYCTFECAAPRLEPQHLDELAAGATAETLGDVANNLSPETKEMKYESNGARNRLHTLRRLIGSDGSLLGTSGWPPTARSCPLSQEGDIQSMTSEDNASSAVALIRPIWIAIPAERVVGCVPRKWAAFAETARATGVVATRSNPFAYLFEGTAEDEFEYHRRYRGALFGATRKKSGWDCMRHYEVLASGSIPWFEDFLSEGALRSSDNNDGSHDVDHMEWLAQNGTSRSSLDEDVNVDFFPSEKVLAQLPVGLLWRYQRFLVRSGAVYRPRRDDSANNDDAFDSVAQWTVDYTRFDNILHLQISGLLLGHTQRRLTTVALAEYLLTSSGHGHLLEANSTGERQGY